MATKIGRVAIAAIATTAVVVAFIPAMGVAQRGQTEKIDSKVVIVPNTPAFRGRVKARVDACIEDRKVKLFKRRNGNTRLLGTDRTNRRGRWKVIVDPLRPGRYWAVVKRSEQGTAGTIYVCKRDKSPVITIVPQRG